MIKIYPIRYDAARPVVENLFGVELPKTAVALDGIKLKPAGRQLASLKEEKVESPKTTTTLNQGLVKEMNQIVLKEPAKLEKNPSFLEFLFGFIKGFFSIFGRK